METKKDINTCLIDNWMSICKWIRSHYHFYWNLKIKVEDDLYLTIKADDNKIMLTEWHPGFYKVITEERSSDDYKFDNYLSGKKKLSGYDIKYLKALTLCWDHVKVSIERQNNEYSKISNFKV